MGQIILVVGGLGAGGAERTLVTLAHAWSQRGKRVTILALDAAKPFYRLNSAIDFRQLSLVRQSNGLLAGIRNNAWRIGRLRDALSTLSCSNLVTFGSETNCLTLLASLGLGHTVTVAERCDPRWYPRDRRWRTLRRLLYPLADAVIVQTSAAARYFQRSRRVHVIPNPVLPIDQTLSDISDPPILPKTPFIAGMGRLTDQKNFEMLLRAFTGIADRHRDWSIVIFGEGPSRGGLEDLIRRLGLVDRVFLPGIVKAPWSSLCKASFFVLPSRYEGFPNALCEAMACGLPVIATDCPSGPRDIVRDGIDGFLVPVDDIAALTAAMERLIENVELRETLARNARDITKRFDLAKVLERWRTVLDGPFKA